MITAVSASALDDALSYFSAQTGLVFPGGRRRDFDAGLLRVMARHNLLQIDEMAERIRLDARLLDELVAELVVHETYFFREPAQFEAIRRRVLPQWQAERGAQAVFNIWSAGCATGEEPYSLAILLEQEGLLDRCRIRATDISPAALARARAATYSDWSFRGTTAASDPRYFRRRGGRFCLEARLRDRVAFEVLNLMAGPYPRTPGGGGFDLILCRNVLIYFDAVTMAQVAGWLFEALNDGGWLIVAPADPPLWDRAPFDVVTTPEGIFYRKPSARLAAPPPHVRRPPVGPLETARPRGALDAASRQTPAGHGQRKAGPSSELAGEPPDCLVQIRLLANSAGSAGAERLAAAAAARHPMVAEIHYLHAVLLLDLNRWDEAQAAVQQVLYLDRNLAAAPLLLGSILRRRGDLAGALRAYRAALACCAGRSADDIAELTDGDRIGRLAALATAEIATLEGTRLPP
jgi:chemotaxis protein methyltransferase CheR